MLLLSVAPEIVKYDARIGLDWYNVYTRFRKSRQVGSEDETGAQTVQTHNCTHTAWRCRKSTFFPHNEGKMVKKVLNHNMTSTTPTTGFENNELTTNRRWSSNGTDLQTALFQHLYSAYLLLFCTITN